MEAPFTEDDQASIRSRLRRGVLRITTLNALLLGVLMAGLNALKPLHIDDNQYVIQARHISQHWGDPYGYTMSGFIWRESGMGLVSPPVIPYWLAVCVATVGDGELALKLWMTPWCVLWVISAWLLARRFAPRSALAVTAFASLSPWILPGVNLMLDVPAQAMMMLSIEVMCRAVGVGVGPSAFAPANIARDTPRCSFACAALSGFLATLAIQTKYTGLVCVPLLGVLGWLAGRRRHAMVAVGVAVAGFVGWEWLISQRYGESHFIYSARINNTFAQSSPALVWRGLLTQSGAAGMAVTALAVWAWSGRLAVAGLLAGAALTWHAMLFIVPMPVWSYYAAGAVFWIAVAGVVAGVVKRLRAASRRGGEPVAFNADLFLLAWLAIECVASVAISPFPAVRRVMGVLLVVTLIASKLAEERAHDSKSLWRGIVTPARTMRLFVLLSASIGAAYFITDYRDAAAIRDAYHDAADAIRERSPGAKIWFLGFWSPKYYGPKFGMEELMLEESFVHRGDYVVFPIAGVLGPEPYFLNEEVREVRIIESGDALPLQTMPGYYGGLLPITHRKDPKHPRVRLAILLAAADFTALSGVNEGTLKAWIMKRRGTVPVGAVRPLGNLVSASDRVLNDRVFKTLDASGVEVVARAATTENPRVRLWAVKRMAERPESREAWRDPLRAAMNDREPIIRDAAAKSIEALGLNEVTPR